MLNSDKQTGSKLKPLECEDMLLFLFVFNCFSLIIKLTFHYYLCLNSIQQVFIK